jgi:hypothetical protein
MRLSASACMLAALLLWMIGAASLDAQTAHRLEVTATEARLDGVVLTPSTTLDALERSLGAPSRRENVDGFELALWDSLGIVVRARGRVLHEVALILESQALALPGGEVFRDPAEPTGTFTGAVQIAGSALPSDLASFAPTGLTCTVVAGNHRCALPRGVFLHVSPASGAAQMVTLRLR